ncbi:MAG: adenylate/guanylate cyclase domain-containing protein, partial [Myxococcales bacterium]|nr:adenylate/guanylate cyclase domain-containing protein [Myxococcales bacterium]
RGKDEVGELAQSFNQMSGDLETYKQTLIDETAIRSNLSRYLSPDLVEQIVAHKQQLALGGERREVTVLFADVVAFTPMAENLPPETIVKILNELFTYLTEIIFRHGGTVDKFLGDCVMAVFGAPNAHDDDPLRAVRAAEEMMSWLDVGNTRWESQIGAKLALGIGINTGEAVAGNIGSEKRMEYTVIGDAVNIAARLESLAQPGQIVLTKATMQRIEDEIDCVSLGERDLFGRNRPVELFAVDL